MNKICTDIKQSKKLIELGIDVNTADMFWELLYDDKRRCIPLSPLYKSYDDVLYVRQWTEPAWSLTALLGLMPNIDKFEPRIEKSLLDADKHNPYGCVYSDGSYALHFYYADNPLDAAFEMMRWLLYSRKL